MYIYVECHYTIYQYAECQHAECLYTECHSSVCHCAEGRDTVIRAHIMGQIRLKKQKQDNYWQIVDKPEKCKHPSLLDSIVFRKE